MRPALWTLLVAMCLAIAFQSIAQADDAGAGGDPIATKLADAKKIHAQALEQADATLLSAFDDAISSAGSDVDASELSSEKDAFSSQHVLPTAAAMKEAKDTYRQAIRAADHALIVAYVRAIRHYAAEGKDQKALKIEQEKDAMIERGAGKLGEAGAGAAADSTDPSVIASNLSTAKSQYQAAAADDMKALQAAVDRRLNSAADAGDLQTVQMMRGAEADLNNGTPINGVTDPAVLAALAKYKTAIQGANLHMARAYLQAVQNYTRARQFDQALAVQGEFVSTGLSGIAVDTAADNDYATEDTIYPLGARLPDFLTTRDRWDVRARGIFLQRRAFIRSKSGDYLTRDFTCDLWFTTESTGTFIYIGVGPGIGRPSDGLPVNSLALNIVSPDNNNGEVGFLRPDGETDGIGNLNSAGDYVARIQKIGDVLTLGVGQEDADGTFTPQVSTTVSDMNIIAPFLTNHDGHIFFGGGRFWQVRYLNGRPKPVIPDTVVASLAHS
ncbi:MAG TPA: hypothetical protein VMD30_11720 [Tepidisphaeraceae bacterium]|nr:hypothetical protein [Tepidisphaeraceae bacterium]